MISLLFPDCSLTFDGVENKVQILTKTAAIGINPSDLEITLFEMIVIMQESVDCTPNGCEREKELAKDFKKYLESNEMTDNFSSWIQENNVNLENMKDQAHGYLALIEKEKKRRTSVDSDVRVL